MIRSIDEARAFRSAFMRTHNRAPDAVGIDENDLPELAQACYLLYHPKEQSLAVFARQFARDAKYGGMYVLGMKLQVVTREG